MAHWWTTDNAGRGLTQAVRDYAPDIVIHLASYYVAEHGEEDIERLLDANVAYGLRLLEAMKESACRHIIYAGTSWQHFRGDASYAPANLYAATKQAFSTLADYYLDAHHFRLLELHLYDSYGEDDPRNKLLNQLKSSAHNAVKLPMSGGEQKMHLVHVSDLCQGFVLALTEVQRLSAGSKRVYRLPSANAISLRELVEEFNAISDQKIEVDWGQRPYRQREIFTPWEDAEILPGWRPSITLAEGLRRLIAKP